MATPDTTSSWLVRLLAVLTGLLLLYALAELADMRSLAADMDLLRDRLADAGWFGPLGVVALMTIAIVLSPLPSAPIALAAGAIYGHIWGTIYVLTGSLLGALIAFLIARHIRPVPLIRWLEGRFGAKLAGSQNTLMITVCVARLLPFLSFDVVSYVAGLTPLTMWRFVAATFVGIMPASFLLAHVGGELGSLDANRVALSLVALGVFGLLSVLMSRFFRRPDSTDSV